MAVRAEEKKVSFQVDFEGKVPRMIQTDPTRLRQVLINLIGNAIKFTKKGGVKIVVEYVPYSVSRFGVSHGSNNDGTGANAQTATKIRFRITDTGIGMNAEQQAKLFRPFVQGDSSVSRHFGGTGLGLAISRRLTALLGGEVDVISELGKGSTFTFTIATGDIADSRLIEPQATQTATTNDDRHAEESVRLDCNILVVDDRRDIRFLSNRILSKAGASVNECEDGQQAVDYVRDALDRAAPPDLIVLDMQMPNLDGYQTATALRKLGFASPIIALTADAMQGDMNKCIEAGCNDYLSKPIDQKQMLQKVAGMLKK